MRGLFHHAVLLSLANQHRYLQARQRRSRHVQRGRKLSAAWRTTHVAGIPFRLATICENSDAAVIRSSPGRRFLYDYNPGLLEEIPGAP